MRPFLEKMAASLEQPQKGMKVLDLGCGTGQTCAFFAAQGALVTGVDGSPSAIEFARQKAVEDSLPISYIVGDVRTQEFQPQTFNLVIDCRFMHCVVSQSDRDAVLTRIHTWLKPGGELWSETMIGIPKQCEGENFFLDDKGVFWKVLGDGLKYPQAIEREGKCFSAIRRIWPEIRFFNGELLKHGLKIIWQEQEAPADEFSVWMVRTRAKRIEEI